MPEIGRLNIGVLIERRAIDHPWQDHEWRVAGLVPGLPEASRPALVEESPGARRYLAGVGGLSLHRADVEAYVRNLTSPRPSIYVALRKTDAADAATPYGVALVTANPYDAEAYMEGDETLVASLPMAAEVKEWIEAFVAAHHRPEPFRKRQRMKVEVEAHSFGQEPIFELRRRLGREREDKSRE